MQKNSVVILINLLSDYFEQVKSFFLLVFITVSSLTQSYLQFCLLLL